MTKEQRIMTKKIDEVVADQHNFQKQAKKRMRPKPEVGRQHKENKRGH